MLPTSLLASFLFRDMLLTKKGQICFNIISELLKKNYKYGYKSCKTYKSIKKDRSKDIHMFMTVPWVIFIPFFFYNSVHHRLYGQEDEMISNLRAQFFFVSVSSAC